MRIVISLNLTDLLKTKEFNELMGLCGNLDRRIPVKSFTYNKPNNPGLIGIAVENYLLFQLSKKNNNTGNIVSQLKNDLAGLEKKICTLNNREIKEDYVSLNMSSKSLLLLNKKEIKILNNFIVSSYKNSFLKQFHYKITKKEPSYIEEYEIGGINQYGFTPYNQKENKEDFFVFKTVCNAESLYRLEMKSIKQLINFFKSDNISLCSEQSLLDILIYTHYKSPIRFINSSRYIDHNDVNDLKFVVNNIDLELFDQHLKIKHTVSFSTKFEFKNFTGILHASADFVLDNEIIEIKTTEKCFSKKHFYQCMVYYILSKNNINKGNFRCIDKAKIYYPYLNELVEIDLSKIDNEKIKLFHRGLERIFMKKYKKYPFKNLGKEDVH